MLENEMTMQVYDGACRNKCPSDFKMLKFGESNSNFTCVKNWKEVCDGDIVINDTSIYSVDSHCDLIAGFVEINLSIDVCEDENLLKTLSKTFSNIEEI